ncbi:ABC transporter permease [Bacillus sp. DTU_2020_1000418_1_SI_GHA_SEK_038]|uniref:ABC transporter permease n=1 Tax=Bacillus sp. DTU_2020_1000418_1_SI_GHA_SEK_038 TaxID=3077585 RepID=UPI0028E93F0B|nr:ABC transporter permease [Bacillus sp. DTU_2020_1000418_1_SI_GHA_SEK_038]WNS74653.1 ABC transporter permease [Bacillus sp. DTU_2020_1000418_1_SI_GHA_SEK_038]
MNSWNIFADRLVRGWKYQYGVIRSIADWTIILYLIIPANAIFFIMYRTWWLETPDWIENIPLFLLFFVLYLFSWSGNIRTFVQEADKVFLIKFQPIFLGMKKWGYAYSIITGIMQIAISIFVFLPFLRKHYLLDWQHIITLFIFLVALNTTILLLKHLMRKIETRLKRIAAIFLLFILLSWFSQFIFSLWVKGLLYPIYMCSAFLMIISIYQSLRSIKKISSIDHDISLGNEAKMKNIDLIFKLSHDIEKPVIVSKRTKPLLFRRSKRIFNKREGINGFLELFIKIFIRNYSYVGGYLQILSVTTAAIVIIPPFWIKFLIFIGFLIMMYSWLSLVWDRITGSNPISKKYSESTFYFAARKRAVTVLLILAILILGIFITCWLVILSQFGFRPGMLSR